VQFIKKISNILIIGLILVLISSLTYFNSIYNSDLHHWGFIAGHSLDYINGGVLFKNVFVQYGAGQLVFFKYINYIYQINFSSIGIITAFIYCLNLSLLYFILKKISSELIALFIIVVIFFCNPYINFPWPDYLASFCLLLFSFFILFFKKNGIFIYLFSGFFLFLSILFRTTYIINIFPALIFYFILIKIDNKFYNERLVNSLIVFLFFFSVYIFYLLFNNLLIDWFYQGIGVFRDYVTGSNSVYMSWVIENLGSNFWILIKTLKVLLRFIISVIIPLNINDFVFLIFFLINLLILLSFFLVKIRNLPKYIGIILNKFKISQYYNLFFFFSLLSFFGIAQSIFYFVFYKNLNASILFFIPIAFLLNCVLTTNICKQYLKMFFVIIFMISFVNLFQIVKKFYITNTSLFISSDIEYFGKRKFLKEDLEYYNFLKLNLCNEDLKVINLSLDTNAPFVCSNKRNFIHQYYYFLQFLDNDLFLRVTNGELNDKEVLITSWLYQNNNLKIYNKILLPYNLQWWGSSSNSKFHYLYKKNIN
jgi:hypothetical protein